MQLSRLRTGRSSFAAQHGLEGLLHLSLRPGDPMPSLTPSPDSD